MPPTKAAEPRPLDLILLRDTICSQESKGWNPQRWARSPDYLDWGLCQIRASTAEWLGFFHSRNPAELWDAQRSKDVALELIVRIVGVMERKGQQPTEFTVAFKYRCGPWARVERKSVRGSLCWKSATEIAAAYRERK